MNPTTEVTSKSCQTYFFSFVRLKLLTKMAVWSMLQAILPWLLRKARIFMPAASWTLHNDIVSNQNVIWDPNRYKKDLSNEVLNIEFGQGATKISKVKVGHQKKFKTFWVRGYIFCDFAIVNLVFGRPGFDSRSLLTLRAYILGAPGPAGLKTNFFERSDLFWII